MDGRTDRWKDGWTNRWMDGCTNRQTDRRTDTLWFWSAKNGDVSTVCLHRLLICFLRTAHFARMLRCAHSFARSLTLLTPKHMGKCTIQCLVLNHSLTVGWPDGRMDWQTEGWMDGQTEGQKNGRTNGRTDRQTNGQTDRRMDGQTNTITDRVTCTRPEITNRIKAISRTRSYEISL